MTSKQEIKDLFTAELLLTPEYQIILNVKQLILNEISTPNIQKTIVYKFDEPLSKEQIEVIKMCFLVEFGYSLTNISELNLVVDMSKFLE